MCAECRFWICFSSGADGSRGRNAADDCLSVWEQPLREFELVVPQHHLRSVGLAANSTAVQLKVAFSQMAPLIIGMFVSHTPSSSNKYFIENEPNRVEKGH